MFELQKSLRSSKMQIMLIIALTMLVGFGQTQSTTQARELPSDQTLEREMTGAETHRYKFDLRANEFFQAKVEQKDIDVMLRLLDASGAELARMDSPNGKQGQETLSFVAEKTGSFVLEVAGTDAKAGKGNYSIRREASRTATAQDRRRVEIERVFVEGMTASKTEGQADTAIKKLEEALAGWRELEESSLAELTTQTVKQVKVDKYAAILFGDLIRERNKGLEALNEGQRLMVKSKSDSLAARAKLNEALETFRTLTPKTKDKALVEKANQSGEVAQGLLDFLKYMEFLSRNCEGLSLSGIAQTHMHMAEWHEYLDYLKLAFAVYQEILADKTITDLNFPGLRGNLIGLKHLEAGALNNIGGALNRYFGQLEEAIKYLSQAADRYRALYQETQDSTFKLQEALTFQTIGGVYNRESKNRTKAIEFFTKSLEIYRVLPNEKRNEAMVLSAIALQQSLIFDYEAAVKNWEKALTIYREIDDKGGQSAVLFSMNLMYFVLNDKSKLNECAIENLAILQSPDFMENRRRNTDTGGLGVFNERFETMMEEHRLNSIAYNYRLLEDYSKALEYYQKALEISRATKEARSVNLDAASVAYALAKLEKWDEAFEYYKEALEISRVGNIREDIADDLTDAGWTLLEAGKPHEALKYQNEALALYQSVGLDGKNAFSPKYSSLLTELARTQDALGNRRLAIFYGKRGVNAIQGERLRLQNLDAISQKGFLENKEKHYRRLADWLISEGRIAEAEQVLALFKQDEYFDSLSPDEKLDAIKNQSRDKILLTDTERDTSTQYEEITAHLASIGKERDELEKKSRNFEAGKFPDQARLDLLNKKLADAQVAFNSFLDQLDARFRTLSSKRENSSMTETSYSRSLLKSLKQPRTVIISTIAGPQRLNLILTTARTYRAYTVDIKAADLNKLVLEFREAVKNRNSDPHASGKKLYDVLFPAGLQKELARIKADKIVWSLDGTLRYAPLSALWDGRQYLVEKYANSVITLASRGKLKQPLRRRATWTALGVGVSQKGKVKDVDGTELEFSALEAVKEELCSVVNDPMKKKFCAQLTNARAGILNGRNLYDDEFTLESFKVNFGRYPVVHIASHFRLNPGNEYTSYLLLGGGNIEERKLTLAAVRDNLSKKFEGVELLTLSACNTAMSGGEKANGMEIESFGAMAQNLGAKSVLATLWLVSDNSTRDLMIGFYREMKINPRIGKTEALRKAQLSLLRGSNKAGEISMRDRELKMGGTKGKQSPRVKKNYSAPFAHPYYWSPFVLMGDWR